MSAHSHENDNGPYPHAVTLYWNAGWRGLLPLPPRKKSLPPTGWTGRNENWPSFPDVLTWAEDNPHGNIALRLPHGVIGIDVDQYGAKPGGATLNALIAAHGPLPTTWRTTSRGDGISGIRLYRVPEGLSWPGDFGPGIDVIQWCHRYALVPPSIHPEGGVYRWIGPDGTDHIGVAPSPDDLPELPPTWIAALTRNRIDGDQPASVTITQEAGATWLSTLAGGVACAATSRAQAKYLDQLRTAARSRHEIAKDGIMRLVRLGSEGHTAVPDALRKLHRAWSAALADSRTAEESAGEWSRLMVGALSKVYNEPGLTTDPCTQVYPDLHGLLMPTPATTTAATTTSPNDDARTKIAMAEQDDEPQRTSWYPRDTEDALEGRKPPPPTFGPRSDGVCLFYAGKVNGLQGPSESGKTWIALHGLHNAMLAGHNVTIIDFEDDVTSVIGRLLTIGASVDLLRKHLRYIGPDQSLDLVASGDLTDHLSEHAPTLIIVDGVNAAMTLMGLDINSNNDATAFAQKLLRPLAATGACVIAVDHVAKNGETKGAIGAQAKRAMITGCGLLVEKIGEFGIGHSGKLRLTVDKDRPGAVRGESVGGKHAGIFHLDADGESLKLSMHPAQDAGGHDGAPFRPTRLMEKVSTFLAANPDGASGYAVERDVTGKRDAVREALSRLVEEGYVRREDGPRNAIIHHLLKHYSEQMELLGMTSPPPRPTSPQGEVRDREGRPRPTSPHTPDVVGVGEGEVGPGRGAGSGGLKGEVAQGEVVACRQCGVLDEPLIASRCGHCRGVKR